MKLIKNYYSNYIYSAKLVANQ